jgi:signal transduction histidine kinase/ActR/RegA family two-component response regulator
LSRRSASTPPEEVAIKIGDFIEANRDAITEEWIEVADSLTPRDLSRDQLLDAVREMLDSIVLALVATESADSSSNALPPAAIVKVPELSEVAKAHASHRFTQRFTLKQMAAEYRALRKNVTWRWLARKRRRGEAAADIANELARFNTAVDLSMASAVAWYDERLRKQQDHLKQADQNKNEFLAVLGHELRNPLSPLRTGMDLLERARVKPELLDSLRPMMDRQLSHLSRLVDDLLDFARISRGAIHLQVAPFDLNAAVETAIEQLAEPARDRQHELVVNLSTSPLPVLGDFDRLTQIIANLLSNACKYMARGGLITVTTELEKDRAAVSILDTGFGIPPEHLESIFELFTQIPEHRQKTGGGGLGIGLSLARRLVEMHQGTIKASSQGLGHGSEFVMSLPLYFRDEPDREIEPRVSREQPARSRRVLVVDDNADAANTFAMLLEQKGHEVRTAYDGDTALAQVEGFRPEVVFLDLGLPGTDGVEIARGIRTTPGAEGIRLFAVTGWSQADDRRRTKEAGFDGHLVKPVTSPQIEKAIGYIQDEINEQLVKPGD